MGQPIGVGYDNVDPKGSGPKFPANPLEIFTGTDSVAPAHSSRP